MKILMETNTSFDMNQLPSQIDELRYCVLDYSDPKDVDWYFIPLIFLDSFSRPAADLKIGKYRIQVPLDWSVVISDKNFGNLEIIEIKQLNDRPFEAFILNPINGYIPDFGEVTIENIFPDVNWSVPKLKNGHILAVPLDDTPNPPCALFVRDINKITDILDITKIF